MKCFSSLCSSPLCKLENMENIFNNNGKLYVIYSYLFRISSIDLYPNVYWYKCAMKTSYSYLQSFHVVIYYICICIDNASFLKNFIRHSYIKFGYTKLQVTEIQYHCLQYPIWKQAPKRVLYPVAFWNSIPRSFHTLWQVTQPLALGECTQYSRQTESIQCLLMSSHLAPSLNTSHGID